MLGDELVWHRRHFVITGRPMNIDFEKGANPQRRQVIRSHIIEFLGHRQ